MWNDVRQLAWLALIAAAGCGGAAATQPVDDTGNGGVAADSSTARVDDPAGDMIGGAGVQWDLRALTIARDSGGITATLELSADAVSPTGGATGSTVGFIDLDLDQDPATGARSTIDEFRSDGGSTGLGVDASVNMNEYASDSTAAVVDAAGRELGRVKPRFDGKRITVRIPRAVLGGDDGYVSAAAIVGTTGRPSDFAPNDGHLSLSRPAESPARMASRVP